MLWVVYHGFDGFFRAIWGSFDCVVWAVREGVLRVVLSSLSFLGDGLTCVAASALFGTWLFCDQFRCIFPGVGRLRGVGEGGEAVDDEGGGLVDLGVGCEGDGVGGWRADLARKSLQIASWHCRGVGGR